MSITLALPASLGPDANKKLILQSPAHLAGALAEAVQQCPSLKELVSEQGVANPYLLISVNGRVIKDKRHPLTSGDHISLISALVGG